MKKLIITFTLSVCLALSGYAQGHSKPIIDHQQGYPAKQYIHCRSNLDNSFIKFTRERKACVAFLGGSITEMKGWRNMIQEDLKQRFPNTNFTFIDAGIGSTGSTPHAFRFEKDVLAKGTPDLLFVEAAVNDDTNGFDYIAQTRGMEGIVRHARIANPNIDIIMLHFIYDPFIRPLQEGQQPDVILNHERVANHYRLPSINLAQEVAERMAAKEFTWEQFGGTHPHWEGHKYYAATISKLFDEASHALKANSSLRSHALPQHPLDSFCYDQGAFLDIHQAKELNGWKIVDDWSPTSPKADTRNGFVHVPMLETQCSGASLTLEFTGRSIGIFCVAGPQAGILEYSVDGAPFKKINTYTAWSGGLYLPWVYLFENELESRSHTLLLKMAKGEKTQCQIRNFVVGN